MTVAQLDVTLDRPLPQSPDAERAVLGAVFEGGGDRVMLRLPNVTTEMFFKDSHRLIWDAISYLMEEHVEIDLLTVKHELSRRGQLEQAGGSAYVSSLTDVVPDIANVERYAAIVERAAKKRSILVAANKAMRSALDPEDEPEETIATLFGALGEQATPQKKQARPLWEAAAETVRKMTDLRERKASIALPTSWPSFDRLQIFTPTLSVLGAHSNIGKSSTMVNIADDLAIHDSPAAIFSLESRQHEITLRHMSMTTGIPHSRMRDWRTFTEIDFDRMAEYSSKVGNRKVFIEDGIRAAEDIVMELRRLKAVHGVKVALIDYVQNVELRKGIRDREERLHEISKMFLDAANDLSVHIMLMSQLRDEAGRDGKRLTISDLAYAKSIAKSARVVLFMTRPIKSDPNTDRSATHMDIQVEKHNEGQTGDFVAQFDEIRQRVWEGKCEKACMHPDCRDEKERNAKQERLY
jgi:replicative DNA helicase